MKRDLLQKLIVWKTHPLRKPLILRGARQVGKSWVIKRFSQYFPSYVEINFEKEEETKSLFDGKLDVQQLLERLSLYAKKKIVPGETLIFFDEVQECERCLRALRYFKEECPELHVIAAGSLIDFTLEKIGMPVGRVQFLYLFPMSFGEFLIACDREDLRNHILLQQFDPLIHPIILELFKNYLWLGGMPAVVDSWVRFRNPVLCQEVQTEIILAYRQDFEKYARTNQIEHVSKVFNAIPSLIGTKFKFSNVDIDLKAALLKEALSLLGKAGIAYPCFHSSGHSLPLGAEVDSKKFKVFFLDIGLAQRMLGLDLREWVLKPVKLKLLGSLAEQLVAQEYIAYSESNTPPELYYWHREEKSSNAEVDFLFPKKGMIIPIEVKSGPQGGMKSLKLFLESHPKSSFGLKIADNIYAKQTLFEEVPLYGIEGWIKK